MQGRNKKMLNQKEKQEKWRSAR